MSNTRHAKQTPGERISCRDNRMCRRKNETHDTWQQLIYMHLLNQSMIESTLGAENELLN